MIPFSEIGKAVSFLGIFFPYWKGLLLGSSTVMLLVLHKRSASELFGLWICPWSAKLYATVSTIWQ